MVEMSVAAFIQLLVTIGSVIFAITSYFHKIKTLSGEVVQIKSINTDISKSIQDIDKRVSILEKTTVNKEEYFKKMSPISLTEKGKLVLFESKGHDYIEKNKQALLKEIKSKNPKTAYDVQTYSEEVIKTKSNLEAFNQIKNYAFIEGIELDIVIKIMGIHLRDFALSDNGFDIKQL